MRLTVVVVPSLKISGTIRLPLGLAEHGIDESRHCRPCACDESRTVPSRLASRLPVKRDPATAA